MTLYTVSSGNVIQTQDVNQVVNWLTGFAASVKDYGAKGDEKKLTDGAITTGTATFTSATALFTAADVGKLITVNGAGATANLNTTISGYTNATTVTLAANAGRTVSAATFYYGTDDTVAITNARNAANTPGGGVVLWPPGIYLTGNQTILPFVHERGSGTGQTFVKLKAGANTDLFSAQTSSINLAGTYETGDVGTLTGFSIEDMTLDGNRDNQTSGPSYPLRFYAFSYMLERLEIRYGYSGGILCDWFGPEVNLPSGGNGMVSTISDIKIHECTGMGFQMGGPHDSFIRNIISWAHTSHGFHFGPNAAGVLCENIHPYFLQLSSQVVSVLCEAQGCSFIDCMIEGSDFVQFMALASDITFTGGQIFGVAAYSGVGLQIGQNAGATAIAGQVFQSAGLTTARTVAGLNVSTKFMNCVNGAINYLNSANNIITAHMYMTSGNAFVNAPNVWNETYNFVITGMTPDGTLGKTGGAQVSTNTGPYAFQVADAVNGTVFRVDNSGGVHASGGINTVQGMYMAATTTAASLATGGTINAQGVADIAVAPTGAVTGVIMQAGYAGQFCIVCNASAYTITMAAQATSHVANGVTCVIVANAARAFFYNGTTSLWYPCS